MSGRNRKEMKKAEQAGWRTTKRERRAYIVGEIGQCCEGGIVTSFMTLFLVFQGIDLKLVAGVMLAVKIIDAVDDVVFGYFIDRLHIERITAFKKITGEGKYLPWFRLTFALFPLFTVLFFLMRLLRHHDLPEFIYDEALHICRIFSGAVPAGTERLGAGGGDRFRGSGGTERRSAAVCPECDVDHLYADPGDRSGAECPCVLFLQAQG